jgi:hypothetical protein
MIPFWQLLQILFRALVSVARVRLRKWCGATTWGILQPAQRQDRCTLGDGEKGRAKKRWRPGRAWRPGKNPREIRVFSRPPPDRQVAVWELRFGQGPEPWKRTVGTDMSNFLTVLSCCGSDVARAAFCCVRT